MSSKPEEKDYSWVWALIIPAIAGSIACAIRYHSPKETIKRTVRLYKMNSSIRAQAIKFARDLPDDVAKINAIFQFVVNEIKYMRDPRGMDYFSNPLETLEIKAGDCDCQSILLSSLLESIGYKTEFVFTPGHVFVRVFVKDHQAVQRYVPTGQEYNRWPVNDGFWIPLEPSVEGAFMGWIAEDTLKDMKQLNVKFLAID